MPDHDDSKAVVGWNPNPVYCGRTAGMRPTGLDASKREPDGGASVAATDPWHANTRTRTGCVGHKLEQKAEEENIGKQCKTTTTTTTTTGEEDDEN